MATLRAPGPAIQKVGFNGCSGKPAPSNAMNRLVFQENLYRRLTLPHSSDINRWSCYGATHRQMH
jgi:hypothetical protein